MELYLLSDEVQITDEDYQIRKDLTDEFLKLPIDFLSKMRHFQPQIGCPNMCSFCSKFSHKRIEYWNDKTLRNVIASLKYTAFHYRREKPLLVWDRNEHRTGVVFPYLDNDIGNYYYLDEYIYLMYKELGVKTRISTVSYSHFNRSLNLMHERINHEPLIDYLAGVRLSLAPYGRVWECCSPEQYSMDEYCRDISNFLKIYRPYYEKYGAGNRRMCVEIRYEPLVENCPVYKFNCQNHFVLVCNNYMFYSVDENICFSVANIKDEEIHSIELTEEPVKFYQIDISSSCTSMKVAKQLAEDLCFDDLIYKNIVDVYLFENSDGIYYAINPKLTPIGNYGLNIYPHTNRRNISGYIVTERFLLNAMAEQKQKYGLSLRDKFSTASWDDVKETICICKMNAQKYLVKGKLEKATYIMKNVIPIIEIYSKALKDANYEPSCFFDREFTIDTGIICNLGRALSKFKGITKNFNEPLTPNHERNYGKYRSMMKKENYAWRLSCGFDDTLLVEKLDLFNTASINGQASFRQVIEGFSLNQKINYEEKTKNYLVPGERR